MRREPDPPDPKFPRFSHAPLPPYRYVPGVNPHPVTDPAGHLFGVAPPDLRDETRRLHHDWRASPHYRFGVDLYNFAYWWEAHEAWEGLWRCCPRRDPLRHALQALIQVSAAHLKRHLQRPLGVRALLARARAHLDLAGSIIGRPLGFEPQHWWTAAVVPYFESGEEAAPCGPAPYPFIVPE